MLVMTTALLLRVRSDIDQSQVVLTMLLVVLGGCLAGGRPLGFALAITSTEVIDFYFQAPYGVWSVPKPLDLVILLTFVSTAFVATELLTRAHDAAARAQARANEVETLSRLGAETLRFASSDEVIEAIASLVRRELDADSCVIVPRDTKTRGGRSMFATPHSGTASMDSSEVALVMTRALDRSRPVLAHAGGRIEEHPDTDIARPATGVVRARILAIPLSAEGRNIGVLMVQNATELELDGAKRRLLGALCFYAALGLERMRLITAAAYSEALRESQRAKDEIFAGVSHDLRTPLTTIKVLAQSGGERSSAAIVEQADRLARLVGDLLDVSRLRAGAPPLVPELNTVEDLIGAALRRAEGIRNGRTIEAVIDYDSPALVGRFDFVHTLRIVGNLLDNALRHTPDDGVVQLGADREEGWVVIRVSDRGPGIPASERARIFEPFYRPENTALDGGHAGLGLSIARTLAEAQGGSVEYADRAGGGSVFAVRLPAADVSEMSAAESA